jgi:multidrug resistance efflux pump
MKWKKLLGITALLAAVAAAVGFYGPFRGGQKTLTLPGTVEVQEVRLGSKVGGRVVKVAIAEGDLVRPGQPLVYFDVDDLKARRRQLRAQLDAARSDLEKAINGYRPEEIEEARAEVASAKARLERLVKGARKEEIAQARSELASARVDRDEARRNWERTDALYPRAASRADHDKARADLGRAVEKVNNARARLDLLLAGSRPEEIAEARAEVARYQARYAKLSAGSRSEDIARMRATVAEIESKLSELDVNLREEVVYAPGKAVVEALAVRPGDLVTPNQSVVRVLRAEDLWVKAYVPETELGKVRLNQKVRVKVDSYPDRRFEGTVVQIASVSEFTPRNVQSADERRNQVFAVKVRVADPQGVFKSGMAAEVLLPLHD